jgi:hypothetical protein
VALVVEEVVREDVRWQRGVTRRRPDDDDVQVLDTPLPDGGLDHPVDDAGAGAVGAVELEAECLGGALTTGRRVQDPGDAVEERAHGALVAAFNVAQ